MIELWSIYKKKKKSWESPCSPCPLPVLRKAQSCLSNWTPLDFHFVAAFVCLAWVLWWQLIALQGMFVIVVRGLGRGQRSLSVLDLVSGVCCLSASTWRIQSLTQVLPGRHCILIQIHNRFLIVGARTETPVYWEYNILCSFEENHSSLPEPPCFILNLFFSSFFRQGALRWFSPTLWKLSRSVCRWLEKSPQGPESALCPSSGTWASSGSTRWVLLVVYLRACSSPTLVSVHWCEIDSSHLCTWRRSSAGAHSASSCQLRRGTPSWHLPSSCP